MRKDTLVSSPTMANCGTISELVSHGHEMLDRHRLADAEDLFHQGLEQSASISASSAEHEHLLSALQGLAEIYVKRSRRARNNDLEWHRMHVHAITAKRRAIECCNEALSFSYDTQKLEWFKEKKSKVLSQLKTLEENMVKSLRRKVLKDQEEVKKRGPIYYPTNDDSIDITWLESLQEYYQEQCKSYFVSRYESRDDLSTVADEEEEPEITEPPPEPKPINFDKVQGAIQRIVRKIAKMGTLKIHKDMTPDQKLNLISPLSGDLDIFKQFSKALNGEELSDSSSSDNEQQLSQIIEDIEPEIKDTLDIIESSNLSNTENTRESSPGEPVPDLPNDNEMPKTFKYGQRPSIPFMLTPLSFHTIESYAPYLEGTQNSYTEDGSPFRYGVYRVWRTSSQKYEDSDSVLSEYAPYTLQTYEEVSPLTKFIGFTFETDMEQSVTEERERFPISASSMNLSLALTLCKMGDLLKKEDRLCEAGTLYKYALGILQDGPADKEKLLKPMGHILKQIGLLKCTMGDFVGGSHLMEECIRLYERCDPDGCGLLVANAWFELGTAYIGESWKENSLFDHIMRTVQEALQVEFKSDGVMDVADDMSDSDESSEGESYSISTQEAIVCFTNALEILRQLTPGGDEYNKLLVDVLTRLADCNIMVGNYDLATGYYEEAVNLFKNIVGSATLHNNAHVLAMLGTANFLLTNYAKAISMYECAHLLQQHLYELEDTNFGSAFTLTMVGISYHCLGHYHKCIAWCIKAFECYSHLYKEDILNIESLQRWFVTETLYTLGFSYGTLNFHEKALYYLKLSRNLLYSAITSDTKQCVRILKAIGDQYVAIEDNDSALQFYNEALDKITLMGLESGTTALQNQLLNRMAGVHVSTKQYSTAAQYLEQALDYQKNMETSIKDDMVEIQRQLSITYVMSGDIDRAIECCQERLDSFREMLGLQSIGIAESLARLGTLYHVKACLQDDNDEMLELLGRAETQYEEATKHEPHSAVCVQYANYLYQQAQYADALLVMLHMVHSHRLSDVIPLCYSGVEQAVLPENLQPELDDLDQVHLDTKIYAQFLALLCYKQLHLVADAWDCLVDLVTSVTPTNTALNHSILGYAMLEMGQYWDAAKSFYVAGSLQHDDSLPGINCWICVGMAFCAEMAAGFFHIYEHTNKENIYYQILASMPMLPPKTSVKEEDGSIRDSGYYDRNLEIQDIPASDNISSIHAVETERNWKTEHATNMEFVGEHRGEFLDKGYYSSEYLERQGLEEEPGRMWESHESVDTLTGIPEERTGSETTWETEEVVETPAAILQMLQQQQSRQDELYGTLNNASRSGGSSTTYAATSHITLAAPGSSRGRLDSKDEAMFNDVIDQIEEMQKTGPTPYHQQVYESHQSDTRIGGVTVDSADQGEDEWVTFAEVEEVETPMAILNVLKDLKPQEEPKPEPRTETQGNTWTETYEERFIYPSFSQSSANRRQHTEIEREPYQNYGSNQTSFRGTYSSEPVKPAEDEWVVEEFEMETPPELLHEIRRRSIDIGQPTSMLEASQQDRGQSSPMVISPEADYSHSAGHSQSWRSQSTTSQVSSSSRMSQEQQNQGRESGSVFRYSQPYTSYADNRNAPTEEEETIWISEETVTTPTAILEAINNNGAHHTAHSHSQQTELDTVSRYGSYHSDPVRPYHSTYVPYSSSTSRTDIKNGNHISTRHQRYRGGYRSPPQEEEVWHTSEETVDTPPEVLRAMLRTQRSHWW